MTISYGVRVSIVPTHSPIASALSPPHVTAIGVTAAAAVREHGVTASAAATAALRGWLRQHHRGCVCRTNHVRGAQAAT